MYPYKLLFLLCTVSYVTPKTKVGLLISKNDKYNSAIKSLTSYAAKNTTYTLITAEYDSKKLQSMTEACCQLVNEGVSVVISKAGSPDTAIQSDIFSPLKIPHLAVSATDPFLSTPSRDYLVRLTTSDFYESKAIYDLIKYYKWPEVSILATGDSFGINGVIELETLLITDSTVTLKDLIFFRTDYDCEGSHQLETIKYSLVKVIVLSVTAEFGRCVLSKAHEMGLMGSDYVWIVTEAIAAQPEYLKEDDGNFSSLYEGLLGMRPAQIRGERYTQFEDSYVLQGGEIDHLTSYTILAFDTVGLIEAALETTLVDLTQNISCSSETQGWNRGGFVLHSILESDYSGISGEISFNIRGGRRDPSYDILNFVDGKFITVGSWTTTSALEMTQSVQFFEGTNSVPTGVAKDLTGVHLRLGTVEEEPFMFYGTIEKCVGNGCWTGMVNDIVVKLAAELGFTYEYIPPADSKIGALNMMTMEWNGAIGDLLADRTDMITVDLSTNAVRSTAIDFTIPFMQAGLKAELKSKSGRSKSFFFMTPFTTKVWVMIFMVNFILAVLISCISTFSPFGKYGAKLHAVKTCSCDQCSECKEQMSKNNRSLSRQKKHECKVEKVEEEDRSSDASLYNSLWLMSTGLVSQTSEALPYCVSGRFLIIVWWAFMLIITSMYTANLTAALTLDNLGTSMTNVLDLLNQDQYKWGVIGSRNPKTMLMTHNDDRYARLVEEGETLDDIEDGIKKVEGGYFVFIDEAPILDYYLRGDCDVVALGDVFQSFDYVFGLRKDSPYKSIFDTYMLKFRESGYLDELWARWSAGSSSCSSSDSDVGTDPTLGLGTLSGVFLVLCLGVGISAVLLLVEFIYATVAEVKKKKGLTFWEALKKRLTFIREDLSTNKKKSSEK